MNDRVDFLEVMHSEDVLGKTFSIPAGEWNGKRFTATVNENINTLRGLFYTINVDDGTEYSGFSYDDTISRYTEKSKDARGTRELFEYEEGRISRTLTMPAHDSILRSIRELAVELPLDSCLLSVMPNEMPKRMSLEQYERTTGLSCNVEGEEGRYMVEKRVTRNSRSIKKS